MKKEKHVLCQGIVGFLAVAGLLVGVFVLPKVPQSFEQSHPGSVAALTLLLIGLVIVATNFFVILLRLYHLLHQVNLQPINRVEVDKLFRQLTRHLTFLAGGFIFCLPAINTVAANIDLPGIRALGLLLVLIPMIARALMIHLTVYVRQ